MFERDNTLIRNSAKQDKVTFFLCGVFAIVTANAPLMASVHTTRWIADRIDELDTLNYDEISQGEKSVFRTALNKAKLAYIKSFYKQLDAAYDVFQKYEHETLWHWALDNIAGLGLTKSAFFVQLCMGKMCCLDIHNMRMMGFDACLTGKTTNKRNKYLELSKGLKSSEIWDVWCNHVADKQPDLFTDGNQVSAFHTYAILGFMPE